jgi:uncharacterized coiled-coil protein SlyX
MPKTSKNKKLNSNLINSIHSKTFTQKTIKLNIEGQEFEILVDCKFQDSKIYIMLCEMFQKMSKNLTPEKALTAGEYFNFLLIKYFTDIDITKTEDYEEQIKIFSKMLDLGIVEAVLNSFDEKEIEKLNKIIFKVNENQKNISKNEDMMKNLISEIDEIIKLEESTEIVN